MQILKVEIFVLVIFALDNIQTEPSPDGENVCLKTETYEKQIETKVQKPKIVKKTHWCWNFLKRFSCDSSVTKWEHVTEFRTFNMTRIVPKCCDGYEEKKEQVSKCLPVCSKGCVHGRCIAPEICACVPGFHGPDCKQACPEGLWGENCTSNCNCFNNGKCDKASGACVCEQGRTGDRCQSSCQDGYYGYMCKERCSCGNYSCHHKTGECFTFKALTTLSLPEVITATESIASEKSFEAHQSSEKYKTLIEDSASDIFEGTKMSTKTDTDLTEVSTVKETVSTTNLTDELLSTSTATNDMDFPAITETTENAEEITFSDLTLNVTLSADLFKDKITTETKLHRLGESEINFSDTLETSTGNANYNKETEERKSLNEILKPKMGATFINDTSNLTARINLSGSEQVMPETNEKKENPNEKSVFKIFHVLPGLFIFSGVSFLTLIIASIWLITKHFKKTKKALALTKKRNKMFKVEEKLIGPAEDFFSSSNCTKNLVYFSDVDLDRVTPILKTFKPLNGEEAGVPAKKETRK